VKIYRELPPTSKPEKSRWIGLFLLIEYHKWEKEIYDYIDARKLIYLLDIQKVEVFFGKRKSFKGIAITHKDEIFRLSKNHRELCRGILYCLREKNISFITVTT